MPTRRGGQRERECCAPIRDRAGGGGSFRHGRHRCCERSPPQQGRDGGGRQGCGSGARRTRRAARAASDDVRCRHPCVPVVVLGCDMDRCHPGAGVHHAPQARLRIPAAGQPCGRARLLAAVRPRSAPSGRRSAVPALDAGRFGRRAARRPRCGRRTVSRH